MKFTPPAVAKDTMHKSGVALEVNTRLQCITGMLEYETKSLEVC